MESAAGLILTTPLADIPFSSPIMTTYIPSLTLPGQVFANPASSILLPVALGAGIGFVVRRTLP